MKIKLILLLLIGINTGIYASKVDTVWITSKSMNKAIPNIVITPDNYNLQKESFSVLYLLHGAGGDFTDWVLKASGIKEYADLYNIIIVCPDGGNTSWYFDSPVDPSMKYETYLSKELIDLIDSNYNTVSDKSGRAITGLSMGGHGAFYHAFKYPDIWGAAGSMSGGMDIRPFKNNWDLPKRLGEYDTHPENWEENTVINMVSLLQEKDLKLIFDCGVDDFFYDVNRSLHEKLIEHNIAHDYTERPGGHSWEYWSNSIKYQLLFFDDFFRS